MDLNEDFSLLEENSKKDGLITKKKTRILTTEGKELLK